LDNWKNHGLSNHGAWRPMFLNHGLSIVLIYLNMALVLFPLKAICVFYILMWECITPWYQKLVIKRDLKYKEGPTLICLIFVPHKHKEKMTPWHVTKHCKLLCLLTCANGFITKFLRKFRHLVPLLPIQCQFSTKVGGLFQGPQIFPR
jgi:hypothetical protein